MNKQKRLYDVLLDSIKRYAVSSDDKEMRSAYDDKYITQQQQLRDEQVTELLEQYVYEYKYKTKSNKWYKGILFGCCIGILIAFCIIFGVLIFRFDINNEKQSLETTIQLISVCVTFLTLIISILKIIAKYVFHKKEDEYITRIVEIIQSNDLKNKKANIKAQLSSSNNDIEIIDKL